MTALSKRLEGLERFIPCRDRMLPNRYGKYIRFSDVAKAIVEPEAGRDQARKVLATELRRFADHPHEIGADETDIPILRQAANALRDVEGGGVPQCDSCEDTGIYEEGSEWAPCEECERGRNLLPYFKTTAEEARRDALQPPGEGDGGQVEEAIRPCKRCKGTGETSEPDPNPRNPGHRRYLTCPDCRGTGDADFVPLSQPQAGEEEGDLGATLDDMASAFGQAPFVGPNLEREPDETAYERAKALRERDQALKPESNEEQGK